MMIANRYAFLLGIAAFATGCASSRPKTLDGDGMAPAPPVVQQIVLEPVVVNIPELVISLPPAGTPEVQVSIETYGRKIRAVGAINDTTSTKTYFGMIGPNAKVWLRANGTFRVEDGWLLVRVSHGIGLAWGFGAWPWVMGARVVGGVDGYTADDHLVIQVDSGTGVTRMFVSGAPAATPTIGQYRVEGATTIGTFQMNQYLEFDGDPTHAPSLLSLPAPAAVEAGLARVRSLAKAAGLLP